MKTSNIVWAVVVLVVVAGVGWYWYVNNNSVTMTPTDQTNTTPNDTPQATTTTQVSHVTVNYTNQGFSPSSVNIPNGGTVTFVNQSSESMWVASNPHPVHTGYDGTSASQHCAAGYSGAAPFDQCTAGNSFTFTFNKSGTWGYHNHADHAMTGTVLVQ